MGKAGALAQLYNQAQAERVVELLSDMESKAVQAMDVAAAKVADVLEQLLGLGIDEHQVEQDLHKGQPS